jgi:hypothetical protein
MPLGSMMAPAGKSLHGLCLVQFAPGGGMTMPPPLPPPPPPLPPLEEFGRRLAGPASPPVPSPLALPACAQLAASAGGTSKAVNKRALTRLRWFKKDGCMAEGLEVHVPARRARSSRTSPLRCIFPSDLAPVAQLDRATASGAVGRRFTALAACAAVLVDATALRPLREGCSHPHERAADSVQWRSNPAFGPCVLELSARARSSVG